MNLTHGQQKIITILKDTDLRSVFYWTGGTLLSYHYLHHRKSFDLDFFTEKPFIHEVLEPFIAELKKSFGADRVTEKKIFDRWEYLIETSEEKIRCEFVYYNGNKKRQAPLSSLNGLLIDSFPDIAANKTMAYIDRNEVKDLFDIYTILEQQKFTVKDLLTLVEKKFGSRFSEFTFWSESAKGLKNLASLRPYLLEEHSEKQGEILKAIDHFFFAKGKDLLTRLIED